MIADPTLESLKSLDDPSRYHCVQNVPIFIPHVRNDDKGKPVIRVTADSLHVQAKIANERAKGGVLGKIQPGHTLRDQYDSKGTLIRRIPESEQPPLYGLFKDCKVGTFGPENKPALLANFYYKKSTWEEAKKYPFRSVEFYPNTNEITTVALLKKDPALDMGMLLFQRDPSGPCYFYSKELDPMADTVVAPELTAEEIGKFKAFMQKNYPNLQESAVTHYDRTGTPAVTPEEPVSRLAKENAELYARTTEMSGELAALKGQIAADKLAIHYEKSLREIDPKAMIIDFEKELTALRGMAEPQAAIHLETLKRVMDYARTPIGQPMVHVDGVLQPARDNKPPTEYERNAAVDYVTVQAERGKEVTFAEALVEIRKK